MTVALLLLPDFSLILLGYALRRAMQLGDHFWSGMEKLVYFVLFPALLFNALTRTHIDFALAAPLILAGFLAMLAGMALALPARRLFGMTRTSFAAQFQCAFRYNTYIGLAVAGTLHGAAGIAAMGVLAGALVPLANIAAVWMLARHGDAGLWRELARNPLILATLAGIACNLAGLEIPRPAQAFLGRLAEAAIVLGLLTVGAALKLRGVTVAGSAGARFYLLAVKLAAVPAAAWLAVRGLGLKGVYADIAVAFGALPTASSAYILAQRMGVDGSGVAWLISVGTLLAMLTLPLWLAAIA